MFHSACSQTLEHRSKHTGRYTYGRRYMIPELTAHVHRHSNIEASAPKDVRQKVHDIRAGLTRQYSFLSLSNLYASIHVNKNSDSFSLSPNSPNPCNLPHSQTSHQHTVMEKRAQQAIMVGSCLPVLSSAPHHPIFCNPCSRPCHAHNTVPATLSKLLTMPRIMESINKAQAVCARFLCRSTCRSFFPSHD